MKVFKVVLFIWIGVVLGIAGHMAWQSLLTPPVTVSGILRHEPETDPTKSVYLVLTGSTVNLKTGSSLPTDSIELQGDIAEAAKDAGIASYWE